MRRLAGSNKATTLAVLHIKSKISVQDALTNARKKLGDGIFLVKTKAEKGINIVMSRHLNPNIEDEDIKLAKADDDYVLDDVIALQPL